MVTRLLNRGPPSTFRENLDPGIWSSTALNKVSAKDLRSLCQHFCIRIKQKDKKAPIIKKMLDFASKKQFSFKFDNLTRFKSKGKPKLLDGYGDNASGIDDVDKNFYEVWSTKHPWRNYQVKWLFALLRIAIWNAFVVYSEFTRKNKLSWVDFVEEVGTELCKSNTRRR